MFDTNMRVVNLCKKVYSYEELQVCMKDKGGGCMKGKDGRLVISEKDRGKLWKELMERMMNVESERDQMVEADMVEDQLKE